MLSVNSEAVVKFVKKNHKFIKENNLSKDQLFNCDEKKLNCHMLPSKILAAKEELSSPRYKRRKDNCFKLLLCKKWGGIKKYQHFVSFCILQKFFLSK